MPNRYFKARKPFDLNPHKYDIGIVTGLKKGYEDNLFIYRLFQLPEREYSLYYEYHLVYYLSKFPQGEREFFTFVWQIVLRRIRYIETKNPFNSSHATDMEILDKLSRFQKYLRSIDQWHTEKTLPEIIAEQHEEIVRQKEENTQLKNELKEAKKLETKEYIDIPEGYLLTFLDLCLKLQSTILPDNRKELVFSQTQMVWCKMIAKYFREGNEEINLETIRRYFPADKENPGKKYSVIPPQMRLFEITPSKRRTHSDK
ncbi:hypothetical protein BDD43_2976 [Mucilaginibacter gracilis]|uniref:Uncharacterized protein n=1 Tax=Mucilaginibacter gracilis TaxID=423350 RepID=A0A495J343_9SPHI|nr:hypothetical protein [Mucilaginibacter gracilis]RKR82788.1 hypothetical protein BDD43_2976 [Mucilaginibacter gracilis]